MKRILAIVAAFLAAGVLACLVLQPKADMRLPQPLFHFCIVTYITLPAAVISVLLTASLQPAAGPPAGTPLPDLRRESPRLQGRG